VFFVLSKTLDVLLSPLSWALLLLLSGVVRRRSAIPLWAPLGAMGILIFFSMEPVSNALIRRTEQPAQRTERPDKTYDAVILLGGLVETGNIESTGMPSYNDHAERLLTTFDVLRARHALQAILSGGTADGSTAPAEGRILAQQLAAWGIDRSRLLVEDASRNTRENAVFSKRIIDAHHLKRLLLITSAAHMPRAVDCFHAVGLEVDALPVDYHGYDPAQTRGSLLPRADKLADSVAALRELAGRAIYRLVGYGKG
jgi:uncharacterized SAM-binding protein YcdF (DUF218 family)